MDAVQEVYNRNRPMPEMFRRQDVDNIGGWDVKAVPAVRGEPYISVSGRIMRVPLDDSQLAHAIRAHEQIHCKISPTDLTPYISPATPERAVRAAEEARVNLIAAKLNFPMTALHTGSEHHDGELLADTNAWSEAVYAVAASVHTGSLNPLLAGVRRKAPFWAESLRMISKEIIRFQAEQLKSIKKKYGNPDGVLQHLGATHLNRENLLQGMTYTIELAMVIEGIASMPSPSKIADTGSKQSKTDDTNQAAPGSSDDADDDADNADDDTDNSDDDADDDTINLNPEGGKINPKKKELRETPRTIDRSEIQSNIKKIQREDIPLTGLGQWFQLNINVQTMTMTLKGAIGRKRVASNIGKNPRRMHRFLTDPERRVFDKTVRAAGGVVLIDCSGSMSLSKQEVKDMMLAAPGCTILAYSQGKVDDPNMFVLGQKGKVCDSLPKFPIGNGNDLPAIQHAVSLRTNSKAPVVWVTDGLVYRSNGSSIHAQHECADYAIKNKVHMEYSPAAAITFLQGLQSGQSFKPTILKRWRELLNIPENNI